MKKALTILLALALVATFAFALVACNDNDTNQNKLQVGDVVAEGSFDAGVALSASKIDNTNQNFNVVLGKIADKEYDEDKVAVYDISLAKGGANVQPSGKVKITMPAPFQTENGYVTYHVKGDTVEELETTYADGKISFETASFSYFVVAGTTGGSVVGPGGNINPNNPNKNFFAYADGFEQGTLTANGTKVPRGGFSTELAQGATVELVAAANNGYKMLGWYKNEKASGSNEKYDEINNPATFTYSGTEKMFVYARFDVIAYEITVNLDGGEFKSGETIPETYNVETDTITLPTPEKGTAEFLGWTDADGNAVTEIAKGSTGNVTLTANWKTAVTKVNMLKNLSSAMYDNGYTTKYEEKIFEGKNLVVGLEDIPYGASSAHGFPMFKNPQAYYQDFTYALGNLGGMFNYEIITELVAVDGDRNVTVGRMHYFGIGGTVRLSEEESFPCMFNYEGELEYNKDGQFDGVRFDFLPNVEGYTDSDGKWIYQGDALNVYTDAKRVTKVGGGTESPMMLEGYNGYQHGGGYNKMEFENKADSNGVCKYDKYFLDYYIIRSRTEDRKYDIIAIGDVEVYIGNKETGRAEKLLITSGNEKKRITITSPIVGEEDWYTTLLFIAKPGGKVIVYNGISPDGGVSYAAADTAQTNVVTFACPSQSKKERFMCE